MDDLPYSGRRAMYSPSLRLRMGERELNFSVDDFLVSVGISKCGISMSVANEHLHVWLAHRYIKAEELYVVLCRC